MSEPCSVTVITLNEERNLRDCLRGVAWADEIIVVDSGSADRTLDIAREFSARIFTNPWTGMREQKNFAAERARHPWILNLDADERLTAEGQAEVQAALRQPSHSGYDFPRKNMFLGQWMRHGGWSPDRTLRLYRQDRAAFAGVNPHANVVLNSGTIGHLASPLIHYTYTSFSQYIAKQYPYADAAARELAAQGALPSISAARIFGKTFWKFIETYLLKRGFLDGPRGLIAALGATFAAYLKQARLWELAHNPSPEPPKRQPPPC